MLISLLISLIAADLVLFGLILILMKKNKPLDGLNILREISQEQKLIKDLKDAVMEDFRQKHAEIKNVYEKVIKIATESDFEAQELSTQMKSQVSQALDELRSEIEKEVKISDKERVHLSRLLQKCKEERVLLAKATQRSEQVARFFDKKVPYQELLREIEDKKYEDARFLLSKGISPQSVAAELGLMESEVKVMLATF